MPGIAQHFERIAVRFDPAILIGVGLAVVLVGLFVWLGGLGFRKLLAIVVGAVGGGICGFFITGRNITLAGLSAALAALIAIMFEKILITIMAAGLAAVLGTAVLAGLYTQEARGTIPINQGEIQNMTEPLNIDQTIGTMKAYIADFSTEIKCAYSQIPPYGWAIVVALMVIFILAGFFLWRLTSALCCATLGTMLIFAGMVLLLLYKGAAPISCIYSRTSFYAAVFLAMIAFGTIVQLLLCQRIREKLIRKKETNKGEQNPDEQSPNWRSR